MRLSCVLTMMSETYVTGRQASEHALDILKGGPVSPDTLRDRSTELLAPVTLGCKTKTAKIIGISISALQRLVSLQGVPTVSIPPEHFP